MKDIILKAENISKQYRLGQVGTGTLSHDLNRWWHQVRGKENPYLKIGDTNDRSTKGESDYVWALQDINFEVERGEVLGIIGKNGAGKSTLLKILSKVTAPTTGSIKSRGRIASLLEVGTGFNGEMTGRENIYLNGAILGMTKKEIASKLDEIIDFSGCERYIDTPVKRYSSGMTVRLAFAVAAFLEPEILVVDEVLAVGDAEFQKKAIGKMHDISRGEGRTILFVSHQLGTIANLCTKGMLLDKGGIVNYGNLSSVLENYTTLTNRKELSYLSVDNTKDIFINNCSLSKNISISTNEFLSSDTININIEICKNRLINNASFSFTIQSNTGDYLTTFVKTIDELLEEKNINNFQVSFDCDILAANNYFLRLAIFDVSTFQVYDLQEMICPFKINDEGTDMARFENVNYGYYNLKYKIT
ncbi:ABC transporter ATP-binding protein [Flavobacterium xanthum]|uniref:Lipopolysaccharide transport system ATP-binding protein n=1 Tax=Flavobacterium xanthum TaxID=69322 RepID=A0A1M7BHF8_9FLAO|nr:ABC transporter ATP-binding protein [Flavobacterium xanthum]SHL54410.1 lipopolysaccharide transport system ATP-binding protein [Flavobacterium xanthum]